MAPLTWDQDSLGNCLWKHTAEGKGTIQTLFFMLYRHDDIAASAVDVRIAAAWPVLCCDLGPGPLSWRVVPVRGTRRGHSPVKLFAWHKWMSQLLQPLCSPPQLPSTRAPVRPSGCWGCGRGPGRLPEESSSCLPMLRFAEMDTLMLELNPSLWGVSNNLHCWKGDHEII